MIISIPPSIFVKLSRISLFKSLPKKRQCRLSRVQSLSSTITLATPAELLPLVQSSTCQPGPSLLLLPARGASP